MSHDRDPSRNSIATSTAREALLDRAFGDGRFQPRRRERLREGRLPAARPVVRRVRRRPRRRHRAAVERLGRPGAAGAAARAARGAPATASCRGLGGALMRRALRWRRARSATAPSCWSATRPTTSRFGFSAEKTGALWLPGATSADRFLALELAARRARRRARPRRRDRTACAEAGARRAGRTRQPDSEPSRTRGADPSCLGVTDMNALTRMTESHVLHAQFAGPIVMIGFGSIGRGMLPLLERHIGFDRSKFVVIDPVDTDRVLLDERGLRFEKVAITRENYRQVLTPLLTGGPGRGMIVNLSVDTSSVDMMDLCKDIDALYIDTVSEPWPGLYTNAKASISRALELCAARGRARRAPPPARRGDRRELLRGQSRHGVVDGQAGAARRRPRHRRDRRPSRRPARSGRGLMQRARRQGHPHRRARHPARPRAEAARRVRQHLVGRGLLLGRPAARPSSAGARTRSTCRRTATGTTSAATPRST